MTEARAPAARFGLPLVGGMLLGAATPPALVAGAEFGVFAGLAVWYAVATAGPRPLVRSYVLGCAHMAWFSWSLHHVLWPAYLAVVVLGGLYFVLATAVVRWRKVHPRLAVPAFAVAVAAVHWLRAEMPEISYPHGQPCHALWQWPVLLQPVVVGGEPLANALLAALAASGVDLARSWRTALPPWRSARTTAVVAVVVAVAAVVVAASLRRGAAPGASVRVAVVEPGVHPFDAFVSAPPDAIAERYARFLEARLLVPTIELLAQEPPLDLILWPESSVFETVAELARPRGWLQALQRHVPMGPATRLLVGANLAVAGAPAANAADAERGPQRATPIAILLGGREAAVVGHQEKQRLVPGGEFLPLLALLPTAAAAWVRDLVASVMGHPPDAVPGRELAPLRTAGGVPFGALLCYDNAFPAPAAGQVRNGAQLLCVLSNEAWYRGGAELWQLVAMTVVRALETGTPFVRCTMDGWSTVVTAEGHVGPGLVPLPSPSPGPRILQAEIALGPGRLPPLAWLRATTGPVCACLLLVAFLHKLLTWARLRVARTAPMGAGGGGNPLPPARSGS
jgi:apolipoprotein N-acyltransferase